MCVGFGVRIGAGVCVDVNLRVDIGGVGVCVGVAEGVRLGDIVSVG